VPRLSTPESVGTGSVSRASRPGGSGTPDPHREHDAVAATVTSDRSRSAPRSPPCRGEACLARPRQRRGNPPSRCRPVGPDGSRTRDPDTGERWSYSGERGRWSVMAGTSSTPCRGEAVPRPAAPRGAAHAPHGAVRRSCTMVRLRAVPDPFHPSPRRPPESDLGARGAAPAALAVRHGHPGWPAALQGPDGARPLSGSLPLRAVRESEPASTACLHADRTSRTAWAIFSTLGMTASSSGLE